MAFKKADSKERSFVYWNESIPLIDGILQFDNRQLDLKRGTPLKVQFDEKEISLNVRCRVLGKYFFIRVTDIMLQDDKLTKQIKLNRKPLIERGLITPVKGFDV